VVKTYRVIRILEEDFGCEGRPEGHAPMCTVQLDDEDGKTLIMKVKDAELYEKHIDEGDYVTVRDGEICKV